MYNRIDWVVVPLKFDYGYGDVINEENEIIQFNTTEKTLKVPKPDRFVNCSYNDASGRANLFLEFVNAKKKEIKISSDGKELHRLYVKDNRQHGKPTEEGFTLYKQNKDYYTQQTYSRQQVGVFKQFKFSNTKSAVRRNP